MFVKKCKCKTEVVRPTQFIQKKMKNRDYLSHELIVTLKHGGS